MSNAAPPPTGRRLSRIALAIAIATGVPYARTAPAAQEQTVAATAYVLNLESSTKPLASDPRLPEGFERRTLYVTEAEVSGVTWYRLRLGFFSTKDEAAAALDRLRDKYPGAGIIKASRAEAEPATASTKLSVPVPAVSGDDSALAKLMREARDSMLVGDYSRAVRLYTKVLRTPDSAYSREAQELLGLARERNGQRAHAKAEYETYLRLYPKGEGAERVKQRLLGLITAQELAPKPLRETDPTGQSASRWDGFGSFSQYYMWDESTDADVTHTDRSALATYLDYTARRRGEVYDVRTRFSGQYIADFTGERDDDGRVSTFFVEAVHPGQGLSGVFGRQSRSDDGLLGRFDGAILTKPISPRTRVNFAAGRPVQFGEEDRFNEHKQFFGISMDAGTFAGAWDFNTFYIRQEVDHILDREAIGGEVRYTRDGRHLFTLLDYDVSFSVVNTLFTLAGWRQVDGTSVNMILDYRRLPVLTTSNALISQSVRTIDELLHTFDEDEVRQLAEDRTAISRSGTLTASHPLTKKLQIMGDVTVSSISGTPASGGVGATPDMGRSTYYSVQLIASDLLGRGDTTIFGTRYADTRNADTASLIVSHRYPFSQRLYVNPRLRFDRRVSDTVNGDETAVTAEMRLNHRYRRDLVLEAELRGEWIKRNQDLGDTERDTRSILVGFRKDFR